MFLLLFPSTAQPGYSLEIGDKPCAESEDDGNEDEGIVEMTEDASSKAEVHELVEVQHGVVAEEEDHGVLPYEAQDGDARNANGEQESRPAAKGKHGVHHRGEEVPCEAIAAHGVLSVPEDVAGDETDDHQDGATQDETLPSLVDE